jgi:uncharacterized membrane protein YfcA
VAPKSFAIGSLAGLMGSLAGMGGGFVMIPLMTHFLRLSQHSAHGTSLFAVAATGIAGAWGFSTSNEPIVQWEAAAVIATCGMLSARWGAKTTTRLSEAALQRALGIFMLLVAPLVPAKTYLIEIGKDQRNEKDKEQKSHMQQLVAPASIGLCSGFLAGLFGVVSIHYLNNSVS